MPKFKLNTDFQLKPKMGRGHKGPNYEYKPKWVGALISGISAVANTFIKAKAGQAQQQAEQQKLQFEIEKENREDARNSEDNSTKLEIAKMNNESKKSNEI